MCIYIRSIDYCLWEVIEKGPKYLIKKNDKGEIVSKPRSEWNDDDIKLIETSDHTINMLFYAVSGQEYDMISSCETAQKMWKKLEVTHKGMCKVKESRLIVLIYEFELFHMKDNKGIEEMYTRLAKIIDDLKALEKKYNDHEINKRIINRLT